jgi:hypothetical protein
MMRWDVVRNHIDSTAGFDEDYSVLSGVLSICFCHDETKISLLLFYICILTSFIHIRLNPGHSSQSCQCIHPLAWRRGV